MSMSRDGLMPPAFQRIHKKFKTPSFATIITGLVVGVPILFTDKTFVLDFTSIATLFAFVLVCGGVLLIPRKEKIAGRFHLPYINGKFIFPLIVTGAIVLASSLSRGYFADKIDFTFEKNVDAFSAVIPTNNFDTVKATTDIEKYLAVRNDSDSAFIKLASAISANPAAGDKYRMATDFVSKNDTTQSKTNKISLIIFWLLLFGLAVMSFIKNYSLIPLMGVSTCLYLLTGMTLSNWLWFGAWLGLGLIIYFLYGYKKSKLAKEEA